MMLNVVIPFALLLHIGENALIALIPLVLEILLPRKIAVGKGMRRKNVRMILPLLIGDPIIIKTARTDDPDFALTKRDNLILEDTTIRNPKNLSLNWIIPTSPRLVAI